MAGRVGKVAQLEREAAGAPVQHSIARVRCERCPNDAKVIREGRSLCVPCDDDLRHEKAREFCERKGLRTVDEMRAFCRDMAKRVGRGQTFEAWCDGMKQLTVDRILVMDGPNSSTLARLRDAGVIDGNHRLIPPGEARRIARDAVMQDKARAIVEMATREAIPGGTGEVAK